MQGRAEGQGLLNSRSSGLVGELAHPRGDCGGRRRHRARQMPWPAGSVFEKEPTPTSWPYRDYSRSRAPAGSTPERIQPPAPQLQQLGDALAREHPAHHPRRALSHDGAHAHPLGYQPPQALVGGSSHPGCCLDRLQWLRDEISQAAANSDHPITQKQTHSTAKPRRFLSRNRHRRNRVHAGSVGILRQPPQSEGHSAGPQQQGVEAPRPRWIGEQGREHGQQRPARGHPGADPLDGGGSMVDAPPFKHDRAAAKGIAPIRQLPPQRMVAAAIAEL